MLQLGHNVAEISGQLANNIGDISRTKNANPKSNCACCSVKEYQKSKPS